MDDARRLEIDAQWDAAFSRVLNQLGTDNFPTALRELLECCCAFNSMIITRYAGSEPPVSLYQDLDDVQAAISVQFYASGPYLLDPFYQAGKNRSAPGVYRLFDLTTESFFRSEYYRMFYRKIRISDEIGLLFRQGGESWIIVSLARFLRQPRFSEAEVANVNAVFQTLSSAVLNNWRTTAKDTPADNENTMEDRLNSFGVDVLSPREAEIVRLVIQGHSTPTAAAFLGISEGTVKVHRHHAYTKLGVTSQAELFSLAMRHLASERS